MSITTERIIGISIGTVTTGIALVRDRSLDEWDVKRFKGVWSPAKLERIVVTLGTYITKYDATRVVIKMPDSDKCSPGLAELVQMLTEYIEQKNIPLSVISIESIKDWYGVTNKHGIMKHVAEAYPLLVPVYNRQRMLRQGYYVKLFEAIASTGITGTE